MNCEEIIFKDGVLNLATNSFSPTASPPISANTEISLQSTSATFDKLVLAFSEDIQIAGGGALNPAYMTVIVDGEIRKVTRSQITPPDHPSIHTASQLALTVSGRALDSAKSIRVSYNPPNNVSNKGFITDLSDNRLASIATQVVDTYSSNTTINKSGIASAYKNLILIGSAPITGYGNIQNNTITGNDANNIIDGLAGADTMIGGGAAETLTGGAGDDSIDGGSGDDLLDGGDDIDTLSFATAASDVPAAPSSPVKAEIETRCSATRVPPFAYSRTALT
jgi:Ca2+-binding RTX toxin-like protein